VDTFAGTVTLLELHVGSVSTMTWTVAGSDVPLIWSVMVNVLGGPAGATMPDRYPAALAAVPEVKFHSYGKLSRPGRKVGHVTASGEDREAVLARARAAAAFFEN